MRARRSSVILVCAVLGMAVSVPLLAAKKKEAPAAGEPIFGEVVDVRVVNVEIVVTDKSGNRVTDLQPGDFRLKVDGKEVPVEFFTEIRGGAALAPSAPPAGGPASVTPGGERVGTSYLVFVDDYFAIPSQRDEVLRKLRSDLARLAPEDRMAIVAWDGGRVTLLSSWTSSASELERALDQALARPARGLDRRKELQEMVTSDRFAEQFETIDFRDPVVQSTATAAGLSPRERGYAATLGRQIRGAVSAVVGAMRGLAAPPGRKVVMLLSGGWPFSIAGYIRGAGGLPLTRDEAEGEELLRPLSSAANLLGYTIYPVDVPGVGSQGVDSSTNYYPAVANGTEDGGPTTDRIPSSTSTGALGSESNLREQEVEGTLSFLARETGGRALLNDQRLLTLASISEDTRSYYWLGFTPSWKGNDKRHVVKVDVRRPGLETRARNSFLDLSRKGQVSMMVESALLFGGLPRSIPMPVRVGPPTQTRVKRMKVWEVPVTLGVPVDVATVVPVDGKYKAELELRIAASDDQGNVSDVPVVPLRFSSDEPLAPGGYLRYETKVFLRGKASRFVVTVYDPLGGRIATGEAEVR